VQINGISKVSGLENLTKQITKTDSNRNETFMNLLKSATMAINETNQLSNAAKTAEISYAMGLTNSTHDLQVAQEKANVALQYTLTVRNAILESYNQIMNIQF